VNQKHDLFKKKSTSRVIDAAGSNKVVLFQLGKNNNNNNNNNN
jgi:hypothetical protein